MTNDPIWVSLSEAAKILGVHPATVRNWADQGHLPSQRTPGGHRRFRLTDLEAWAQAQRGSTSLEAQLVVQSAVGRVRFEIGEGHFAEAAWYREMDDEAREYMKTAGRRLMETLQRHLSSSSEGALIEARQIGIAYGEALRKQGLKLSQVIEGFFTFNDAILSAVLQVAEMSRPAGERTDAVQKVYAFTREIILALVDTYGG